MSVTGPRVAMAIFVDLPTSLTVLNSCSQVDLLTASTSYTHWGSAVTISWSDIMLKQFSTHCTPTMTINNAQHVPSCTITEMSNSWTRHSKFHSLATAGKAHLYNGTYIWFHTMSSCCWWWQTWQCHCFCFQNAHLLMNLFQCYFSVQVGIFLYEKLEQELP